jgi:PAS domain S-box-containing protein
VNTRDRIAVSHLKTAVGLMCQGAVCDTEETLREIDVPDDSPLFELRSKLQTLVEYLTKELASKEMALAAVQTAMWELEAAQQSVRSNELRLRTTLACIGDGLISTDTRGRIEFMNSVAEQLTGWSAGDAQGLPVGDVFRIVDAQSLAMAEDPVARALSERQVVNIKNNTILIARDKSERQIADSCAPIRDNEDKILGAVLVFRDVSEEYRRREQLRESEERYRTLIESATDGILVADVETKKFLYCNKMWRRMFGYLPEEVSGLGVPDIHPQDSLPKVIAVFEAQARGEKVLAPDLPCRRKDGSEFFADVRSTSARLNGKLCNIGFFSDTSERKEYEQKIEIERGLRENAEIELRHSQKLQAVGQLAAGIAHEINTPAQFIGDSLHFLADSFRECDALIAKYREALARLAGAPGYEEIAKELKEAEVAADFVYIEENAPAAFERALDGITRVSTIVKAMKEFAHPDQREKNSVDLNHALQTTLTIAKNEYKYVADIETELGELPPVMCHIGDVNQVFLNLLVNAAHAISDVVKGTDKRGTIRIQTRTDGDNAIILISDTGSGIPEAIRDRIFEPFFTTKEVGRGSGQGLAIARSVVVDKHGGSLTFESEVGKGTTFIIRLPINDGSKRPSEPR